MQEQDMPDTAAERWFGARFSVLDPWLQDLHRRGGCLRGEVAVHTGYGPAEWRGKRVPRCMGLAVAPERQRWCG